VLLPGVVLGIPGKKETVVDLSTSRLGRKWTECIDKEWLREVQRKGKEMGNVLEKYVLSSAQVLGDVEIGELESRTSPTSCST